MGVVGFKIVLTLRAGLSSAGNAKAQCVFQTSWILIKVELLQPLLKTRDTKSISSKGVKYLKIHKVAGVELRNTDMLMGCIMLVHTWSPVCMPRPCSSCRTGGDVFCPVSSLL